MTKKLAVLDLFSGIGGFSLGLERTGGFETKAFCEIEPFCRKVLAKHWPDVPCYDDVRTLTADQLAADRITVDVICGGFPCQDISVAGRGAGIEGERSGLYFELRRLVEELRPVFVIIENVPRLRTLGADRVLSDLEELGYACEPCVVGAVHAGAPHRRQRAWLVAHAIGEQLRHESWGRIRPDRAGSTLAANYGEAWSLAFSTGDGWGARRERRPTGVGARIQNSTSTLADANGEPMVGTAISRAQRCAWDVEPDVGRVVDGLPASMVEDELRALGNAVVPQIPELIGNAILASLTQAEAA